MEITRHISEVAVMQQSVSFSLSSKIPVNDGDHNLSVDDSLALYKVEVMASSNLAVSSGCRASNITRPGNTMWNLRAAREQLFPFNMFGMPLIDCLEILFKA